MNTNDLEFRLKQAAIIAAPPRSIAEEVLRQLPTTPHHPPRPRWKHPAFTAALATLTGIAALLAIAFLLAGNNVRLTLADVQSAVENQQWAHVRWDVGQLKEEWTNLQTGEGAVLRFDGGALYSEEKTNTFIRYDKNSGVLEQGTLIQYSAGQQPPLWTPHTAWEQLVAPYERSAATPSTQPASSARGSVFHPDTLNGSPVVRIDNYGTDAVGNRLLCAQLWADPRTRLPLRIKTRLQLAERDQYHQEWSTGDYDFPATGPADIYALGVSRDLPIQKIVTTAPADVQPILDAINRAHDHFLKDYRAITIHLGTAYDESAPSTDPGSIDSLDIIWHEGENLRQDRYLPAFELQSRPLPPLPSSLSPDALLEWASKHEPVNKQLMDASHEYIWNYQTSNENPKPRVQVGSRNVYPLLANNEWPEYIQWPTWRFAPDFERIPENADTPPGTIGLRTSRGDYRGDFYVDPLHDYICIKQIAWTRRGSEWIKSTESTLSDLHDVGGHTVASTLTTHNFADPARKMPPNTSIVKILIQPLGPADYPPQTFDPASLTAGATVEGY
jgi:hypothetical protein